MQDIGVPVDEEFAAAAPRWLADLATMNGTMLILFGPDGAARSRFVVTNTGQSPLSDVTIVDPMIPFFCDSVFDIGTLAPHVYS